ncbi:F-box/kelch-repeat protein At3g06240-like [Neltuma alba]|uniref:F-box/kelch-repeat protein At3g06240-like n=1 Tax=Neltuma alba TaxID=207710 RepID=UPI0010A4E470|nr:F-box/kelch-repeat protein At3g06240-like [Prosopis alba]
MDNLPNDLKLKILVRLPIKSLMRLKCLSKSWLSLISDPYFAKLHFQQSSQQHPNRILYTNGPEILSIDFNLSLHDDSAIVKLDLPLFKSYADRDFMTASCRGFVFLKPINERKVFLLNPSTRICKQIPLPPSKHNIRTLYGFCYDELADDYLIVLASEYKDPPSSGIHLLDFEVFSIRTNSWEEHGQFSVGYCSPSTVGFFLNNAVHWLVQTPSDIEIIAFDITTKSLREIPTPFGRDCDFVEVMYDLRVLEGCLTVLVGMNGHDEIWMMREYGVKSSWTKFFSLSYSKLLDNIFPLCFTKDGQLVGGDGHIRLSKWNEKGELQERRQYFTQEKPERRQYYCCFSSSYYYLATPYTETLLSLP